VRRVLYRADAKAPAFQFGNQLFNQRGFA